MYQEICLFPYRPMKKLHSVPLSINNKCWCWKHYSHSVQEINQVPEVDCPPCGKRTKCCHGWVDYSGLPGELSTHCDFDSVWCSDVFFSTFISTVTCTKSQMKGSTVWKLWIFFLDIAHDSTVVHFRQSWCIRWDSTDCICEVRIRLLVTVGTAQSVKAVLSSSGGDVIVMSRRVFSIQPCKHDLCKESLCYKWGERGCSLTDRESLIKDNMMLHYGNYRIQYFWSLTHTRD